MKKNQKGFSVVEVILIVVLVGIIGGLGWYVYNQNKKNTKPNNTTTSTNTSNKPKETEVIDKEAQSWALATSKQGGFSIKIPDGWEVTNYGESDHIRGNQITYKAGQKAVINTLENAYAGDSLVRFQVVQFKDGTDFKMLDGDEKKTPFKLGDISGTRYYKQYPLEELTGVGPIPGEEDYKYEFKTSGKITYVIFRILNKNQYSEEFLRTDYNQNSSDPNQLELVERVVKTLNIN